MPEMNNIEKNSGFEFNNSQYCEYKKMYMLNGISKNFICIPESIILNKELDTKRISIFSYLLIRSGIDNEIDLSIPSVVKWCKNEPNTRKGKINDKFLEVIEKLKNMNYISYNEELTKTSITNCYFNKDKIIEEIKESSFSVIYLDEINKILEYEKYLSNEKKDEIIDNSVLLLVFASIRNLIYRRPNKLKPEERNIDDKNSLKLDIDNRRKKYPEVYNGTYSNISESIGITYKMFSKAVHILEDIGLIKIVEAFREARENGNFRTQNILFLNTYKREGCYLLDSGDNYMKTEIENKINQIQKYNKSYLINKKKKRSEIDE